MYVTLLYFDGCPNWQLADARMREAMTRTGLDPDDLVLQHVHDDADAARLMFTGSPTLRLDDVDPFATAAPVGFACRIYDTPEGREGSPTVEQLVDALRRARRDRDSG